MKTSLKHIISASTLAVFIFIAFGSMDDSSSEKPSKPSATEKIESDANLTQAQKDSLLQIERVKELENRKNQTVSARDLYYTYQENEVSADNNFKGKIFYVEGTIGDIGKDLLDDIYITLKTGEVIGSVQCFIDDADLVAQLRKGQKITVFGECSGLMMNVIMRDCEVVENLSDLKRE